MRRHKAWRGGSNSAAKLRTRHRASKKVRKIVFFDTETKDGEFQKKTKKVHKVVKQEGSNAFMLALKMKL